jgi:hypothetical protein
MWIQWITAAPLMTPISLTTVEELQIPMQVRVAETYSLHFLFERDGVAFEELKSSIGDMGLCLQGEACSEGVPVPIRWSITPAGDNKPLLSSEMETKDSNGWSRAHVSRFIADLHLDPGHYIFKANVLRAVPELTKLKTSIAIELQPKHSSSWQLSLVWWGSIAQYIITLPVVVWSAIALLLRKFRSHKN